MFHPLELIYGKVDLPRQFTFPFCYTPHPLAVRAAEEVRRYVVKQAHWEKELAEGKMFGVLVVRSQDDEIGFLAAFSGQLAGSYLHDFFVPPVYDLNHPSSFFREEEKKISLLNQQLDEISNSPAFLEANLKLEGLKNELGELKCAWKKRLADSKLKRDEKRREGISPEENEKLIKESQFLKAEARRVEKSQLAQIEKAELTLRLVMENVASLREERKQRSKALQQRLFEEFKFKNAKGEERSLYDIFAPAIPPSGAGECAAPKLLQYAYLNHLEPLCMAEFWWGKSPKSIIRKSGSFYPSCVAKCKPILSFMMEGLDVEPNPLQNVSEGKSLEIVYEDDAIIVIDKPAGMLSVSGKVGGDSAEDILRRLKGDENIKVVHRLDMATSGLLVAARSEQVFVELQRQFSQRLVEKCYVALLDGVLPEGVDKGVVNLPLSPDWEHRPCQKVDYEEGKEALTRFEVLQRLEGRTKVHFFPITGRTHQLRVHAAHPDGLAHPILGDTLYGDVEKPEPRLYLQAKKIRFHHPDDGREIGFELPDEF
jgi:tRNA pseudouridine32 synthase/23S rRNA pseudouridine746 synthase